MKLKENGYRVYSREDIKLLRIISTLRCANYSLSSILKMLNALSANPDVNIKHTIGMSDKDEDIINACDNLLISINEARNNSLFMHQTFKKMKKSFKINPPF